jgi:hypothetical protein
VDATRAALPAKLGLGAGLARHATIIILKKKLIFLLLS